MQGVKRECTYITYTGEIYTRRNVNLYSVGMSFRDRSLITGRGGATKQEGGGQVLPLQKGGTEKV